MHNEVWNRLANLTEEELREEVLMPILQRTPGLEQVTDVHGSNERGLDIIFFSVDQIRRTCYGVQIKRGDISGGGSRAVTVKTIIDQLELAHDFEHPVAVQPAGEHRVDRFIVANNGKLSSTARQEIAKRISPTSVEFWDLSEIIRRARKVFPEILQTADREVVEYLQYVEARAETLDALDQISHVANRSLSDVFVEPTLRRRMDPTLADSSTAPTTEHTHTIKGLKIGSQHNNIVLLGEQNEGKSALLRMLSIRRSRRLLDGDSDLDDANQVPVPVRALSVLENGTLREAIALTLERGGAKERAGVVREGASLEQYTAHVDGFSELPTDAKKQQCAALIENGSELEDIRVIVAARPGDFLRPGYFDTYRQYTISPWDSGQVRNLVRKWTEDSVQFADVAQKMVNRVRDALQLPGSPIPAIIGVMLYEKERRYITNTAEAVDRYMVIRLGRYAEEMGVHMEVDWTRKQDLLAEVAFQMVDQGLDRMHYENVVDVMDRTYEHWGEKSNSRIAIQELHKAGVLGLREGYLSFHRTAFRDFFAAHRVRNREDEVDGFFREHLFDRRWGQVLVFAAGLRRHNTDLLERLNNVVKEKRAQLDIADNEDYLYGAYLLGRILSNSDAAHHNSRLEVLRTSVQAAHESSIALAQEAKEQFGNIGEVISLVGTEHTLFVTVGVPWLAEQFRELADDESLDEAERYLIRAVYAHLGSEGWIDVLEEAVREARNPRVIAALVMLVHVLDGERPVTGEAAEKWQTVQKVMARKRERYSEPVNAMFEVKGPLLEIERRRMRRLNK